MGRLKNDAQRRAKSRAAQRSRIELSHAHIVENSANEPGLFGGDLPLTRPYADLTSDIFTVVCVRRRWSFPSWASDIQTENSTPHATAN